MFDILVVFVSHQGNHLFSESDLVHFHTDLLRDQEHSTPLSAKRNSLVGASRRDLRQSWILLL